MIKIFENKIDETFANLSDEQEEQHVNFEQDNNEVTEEQVDAGKEVKFEFYRFLISTFHF